MNEIIEEWLPVVGYEGLYEVSNLGKVKSIRDRYGNYREKILKFGKKPKGYLVVNLCKEGKYKTCYVHRLVATAFIPNPNCYRCVNHKDENPSNNIVSNLEWCTHQYNLNYKNAQQRRVASIDWKRKVENTDYKAITAKIDYKAISEKLRNRQDLSKQVYQYTKDYKLVAIFSSTKECSRNGFHQSAVSQCCNGKLRHYKNYLWSYEEIKKEQGN